MLADAYGYGGYAAAVNDPTIDPRKGPDKMAAPNVGIVEVGAAALHYLLPWPPRHSSQWTPCFGESHAALRRGHVIHLME